MILIVAFTRFSPFVKLRKDFLIVYLSP
jgi:hypothetical protein